MVYRGEKMNKKIDVNMLRNDAKKSCCRESYVILEKNQVFSIGAGAILNGENKCDFFLDITINLCSGSSLLNNGAIEKGIALAKELKARDYELDCQEGQVISEKSFKGAELNQAFEKLMNLIEELGLIIPA